MTKKVLLVLTCLVLTCCMLCACSTAPEQMVLDQFSAQVKGAKSITADILVKDASGMEVSGGTVVMDFASKQRTVTLRTPNTDFTTSTAWKITEETTAFDTNTATFGWQVKDFSTLAYDAESNSCNGVIGADVVKQLGLDDVVSSAQGSVNVKLLVTGNVNESVTVNSVALSYLSANGNTVVITLTTQAK